jgi:hypothetical protein
MNDERRCRGLHKLSTYQHESRKKKKLCLSAFKAGEQTLDNMELGEVAVGGVESGMHLGVAPETGGIRAGTGQIWATRRTRQVSTLKNGQKCIIRKDGLSAKGHVPCVLGSQLTRSVATFPGQRAVRKRQQVDISHHTREGIGHGRQPMEQTGWTRTHRASNTNLAITTISTKKKVLFECKMRTSPSLLHKRLVCATGGKAFSCSSDQGHECSILKAELQRLQIT